MSEPIKPEVLQNLRWDETSAYGKPKNIMGKDEFMKLLLTQLQHQDPLKPMDHQEFAAQLAQFGSLEQLQNIGTGIQGLRTGIGDEAKLQALGMIGKHIQSGASEINLVEGQSTSLQFTNTANLKPTKASIYDASDKLVREIDLSRKVAGSDIVWDGKNQDGNYLSSGRFTFRVHGTDESGTSREIGTELSGRVTGVVVEGQTPLLIVQTAAGETRLDLARVRQVTMDGENKAPAAPPAFQIPPQVLAGLNSANEDGEEASAPSEAAPMRSISHEMPEERTSAWQGFIPPNPYGGR